MKKFKQIVKVIYENNIKKFKKLLNSDLDLDINDDDGNTLLHIVCKEGNIGIFQLLFEKLKQYDIDLINIKNYKGYTPLHISSKFEDIEIIKLLLSHPKINVNSQDNKGYTPLHVALEEKNIEIAKLLLAHSDIDVNIENDYGLSFLHEACKRNSIEIFKLLLKHSNININCTNRNLKTPLYLACINNRIEIFKLLLVRPDIKIDFDITEFKNQVEIYPYLKRKQNINLDKVNKILDMIEN